MKRIRVLALLFLLGAVARADRLTAKTGDYSVEPPAGWETIAPGEDDFFWRSPDHHNVIILSRIKDAHQTAEDLVNQRIMAEKATHVDALDRVLVDGLHCAHSAYTTSDGFGVQNVVCDFQDGDDQRTFFMVFFWKPPGTPSPYLQTYLDTLNSLRWKSGLIEKP